MVPDLPGVYAVGETAEETRELIAGAIVMHIRALVADNEPVPEPSIGMQLIEITIYNKKRHASLRGVFDSEYGSEIT